MQKKKKKVWIIVVIIIVVLAGLYGIGSKDSKEETVAPVNETKQEQQITDDKEQNSTTPAKEPEKQPEVKPEKETVQEVVDTTPEPANETTENNDGIRQELKDFLASYEAFMDEYCAFMKSYDSGNISMLAKYTSLMSKYTDFAQKADAWKNKDMNNAELIYYTEVLNRVNIKLLEVSQNM